MKKLLLVVLAAGSFVALSEAKRCCPKRSSSCAVEQEDCSKPKKACCIRGPQIVECSTSCDVGCKPVTCGVVPAPIDLAEHTQIIKTYTCVPNPCSAPITPEQLEHFKKIGAVSEDTKCQ